MKPEPAADSGPRCRFTLSTIVFLLIPRRLARVRVGTARTEAAANVLVTRRRNQAQPMRWSRRGADLWLQIRGAVVNGKLGSGFGHRFEAEANSSSGTVMAA